MKPYNIVTDMPPKALRKDELEKKFFEKPNLEGHIVPPIFKQDTIVMRIQYHEPINIDPILLGEFATHFSSIEDSLSLEINNNDDRGPQIQIEFSRELYNNSS